ncbi:hypothetical protein V5799_012921 [Amblyomma americanum]|uniref:Uncharacterized protein n=1 Tax=Amblyomma americanum TaxID=6943 RepID=A0AAQ4E7G0_AMBAM
MTHILVKWKDENKWDVYPVKMIEDAAVGIRLLTQENAISELRGQEVRVRWEEGQDAAPAELLAFGKPTVLERKRKKIVAAAASAEEIATASSTSVQGSGAASPVQMHTRW